MIKKISIIGAGGVGSSLAFNILSRLAVKELVLVDISQGLAKGVALDLEDTRGVLSFSTDIKGTNNYSQIKGSDIVVIAAGVARRKGMTRIDLLKINAEVAKKISAQIKRFAPNSIVIVVTNPLDIITYVVAKQTKFSRGKVFGMGSSLDTSRLKNLFYKISKVSVDSLGGFIYGAHSKDMIVSGQRIKVSGVDLDRFLNKSKVAQLRKKVQLRGAEIVSQLKNKSAHFAPGLACCVLIEAIANDSNKIIPVSAYLKGEYGLSDVCIGVPCIISRKGIAKIIELKLTPGERKELTRAKKLFKECMI